MLSFDINEIQRELTCVTIALRDLAEPNIWIKGGIISPILSTFLVIAVTLLSNKKVTDLQKKIHDSDTRIAYQEKYLEIYTAFSKCSYLLAYDITVTNINTAFTQYYSMDVLQKIIHHRAYIKSITDQAWLIFRKDESMKKMLNELTDVFLELSAEYINLQKKAQDRLSKTLLAIKEQFPELDLEGKEYLSNILSNPNSRALFEKLSTTEDTESYDKKLADYRKKFSYENFDKYFEPYLDTSLY